MRQHNITIEVKGMQPGLMRLAVSQNRGGMHYRSCFHASRASLSALCCVCVCYDAQWVTVIVTDSHTRNGLTDVTGGVMRGP